MASADDHSVSSEEVVELNISNSDVVTKYRTAADIVNRALKGVIGELQAGKVIADVCAFGDTVIERQCDLVYKSKQMDKGVAFPTCLSVNEVVSHYSPIRAESATLSAGDVVHIDMGAHIDGFIAVVGHTYVVPGDDVPETHDGALGNVVHAAHVASEVAHKLLKAGTPAAEISRAVARVAEEFGVKPMLGVSSHRMKQFILEGNETIPMYTEEEAAKPEDFTVGDHEVYAIDVMFTTGDGKARESEERTTVFRREVEQSYRLKMKASRYVLGEVNKKFPTLPFTIRMFTDEKAGRLGVTECVKHGLLTPYPVMMERAGTHTAHFKFTALVMPNGTSRITNGDLDVSKFVTEAEVGEETKTVLAMSSKKKKKNKKKKKAAGAGAGAGEAAAPATE